MTSFIILSGLLLLLAIGVIARPLLRAPKLSGIESRQVNIDIFNQRLEELDKDLSDEQINQQEYDKAKQELERQLVLDVPTDDSINLNTEDKNHKTLLSMLLLVPLVSIGLYLYLGTPAALNPEQQANKKVDISELISKLERRVQQEPDKPEGWRLLARSYTHIKQYKKAEAAYAKLVTLVSDNAQIWADYADIKAVNQKGQLKGEPFELVKRALSLNPRHPKSLWLAGTHFYQNEQYDQAIQYWSVLQAILPPDSGDAQMLEKSIASARKHMGSSAAAPKPSQTDQAASLSGTVKLADELKSKTKPDDVVFVFARATNGPRMPLAVIKKQVSDLPFDFKLDDSMAMMPQMKLSSFKEVVINARISKSGQPGLQKGDLVAQAIITPTNTDKPLVLFINKIAK